VIAFPAEEGLYGRILGTRDGKVLYSYYPAEGALERRSGEQAPTGSLMVYNFEDLREDTLAYPISGFDLTSDGSWLIYSSGSRLRVLKAGEKPDERASNGPSRKTGWLNLGRIRVLVLPGAEWKQMFREAWRLQRDQFWTPDMSQVDWIGVHDRYLPLVDRVSSRSEFSDLMGEMQGELGTSHTYEWWGDYRTPPVYGQGFLGADFRFDEDGEVWRIERILRGDPWNPEAESPLQAPGLNLKPGDRLLALNGRRLGRQLSPAQALVNLAGQEVFLTVAGEDGEPRQLIARTLTSEGPVHYRQWVEANRRRVHKATGGRAGYLHIPDMDAAGYAEFHRGYLAEVDRQGLIVDVRFNAGGAVSSLLLEKLSRRRLGYGVARWQQVPMPYPPESVAGPLVALTNEFAGSDGDIFSHSFKLMQLGPLIGKRTWGGVIGYRPRHALVDGTVTTQPEFSFWFTDVGWKIENYGADPDIEVDNTPQDYALGADAQLERGIQEMLRLLEASPEPPVFDSRPSRAAPRLPRRPGGLQA
jgi:tricorn protease